MQMPKNTLPPRPSEPMPGLKRTVRADSLSLALNEVRENYGPDALVVNTRSVIVRGEDLAPRRQVEIELIEADSMAAVVAASPETMTPTRARLAAQLERLERIARRVESMSLTERRSDGRSFAYPLRHELRARGTSTATIHRLSESFAQASERGSRGRVAARRHLGTVLRASQAPDFAHLAGEHWFMGRAGVGKTTLVLQLAEELKLAGRRVAVIGIQLPDESSVRRLESSAIASDFSAAVVRTSDQLDAARECYEEHDVVLVDTPCCISTPRPLVPSPSAFRHLVVAQGEDPQMLSSLLQSVSPSWSPDTLAVSQRDLCSSPGRLLDLASISGCPIAFFQWRERGSIHLELATSAAMIQELIPEDEAGALSASAS